jgi:nitrile hydratase subunit beta
MDGIHDMGGMHGFGPVDPHDEHPISKQDWRGRMWGVELAALIHPGMQVDWIRHAGECMAPSVYLNSDYFDRWYLSTAAILIDEGWVTLDELKTGRAATKPAGLPEPMTTETVEFIAHIDMNARRPAAGTPAFKIGDLVRARLSSPLGHTRLPRYVRGHTGRIELFHGWQLLADAGAKGEERAEPLYCVSFLARDLWDDVTATKDRVCIDLWESYLEPA